MATSATARPRPCRRKRRARWPTSRAGLRFDRDVDALIRSSPTVRIGAELARLDLECRREERQDRGVVHERATRGGRLQRPASGDRADEGRGGGGSAVAQGFETLKLKVGGAAYLKDERRLAAVREAVGPAVRMRLDANGRWNIETALLALADSNAMGSSMSRTPSTGDLSYIRSRSGIPIAADESIRGIEDVRRIIRARAVGLIVLKPMAIGVRAAFAIAREARSRPDSASS